MNERGSNKLIELLKILMQKGGSDLHLIAGLKPAIRVDGVLNPLPDYDRLSPEEAKRLVYSILTEKQKKSFESHEEHRYELDFSLGISRLGRFRFNVHKQRGTVAATIRALALKIPELDELGLPKAVRVFTRAKKGLVLITGPTGSGKSTTLAAMIEDINRSRHDHIITIEDPIEYLHNSKKSYVTQREVGLAGDTLSFKNALKYALRQDPDVILIGEMRDYETMGIALTSAETGHLVFGTLHTSSAAKTITRIIDVFPAEQQPQVRLQLASNLLGIVSQILLPRSDGPGRVLATELIFNNAAISNNIRNANESGIYQTIQTSRAKGMQTMDHSLIKLCSEGKIDFNIARPYITDSSTYRALKKMSSKVSSSQQD